MPFPILDLANELVRSIVDHIDDQNTLRSLARTCSQLQYITEPRLYRSILQRTGNEAIYLASAVAARKERRDAIQVIDSRCKWQHRSGLVFLPPVIAQAKNLQQLTIESPCCNRLHLNGAGDWKDTMYRLLRPVCELGIVDGTTTNPLSKLKQLTLHLSGEATGERFWDVGHDLSTIFAHPSLESLTISCADIHKTSVDRILNMPRTPLRSLEFIECNIDLLALDGILSLPSALEQLYLGQNCHHSHAFSSSLQLTARKYIADYLCGENPTAFFASLGRQKDSLKSFSYAVNGSSSSQVALPSECDGFAGFAKLENIALKGHCPYFERALTLDRTAPPGLVSLKAEVHVFRLPTPGLRASEDYHSQVRWMITAASVIGSLRDVSISTSQTFTNMKPEHRDAIIQLGETFGKLGAAMRLFKRIARGAIPPFLYGEKPDTEELVYASEFGRSGFSVPSPGT